MDDQPIGDRVIDGVNGDGQISGPCTGVDHPAYLESVAWRTIRRQSSIDKIRSQVPSVESPVPKTLGASRNERHETRSGPEHRVRARGLAEVRSDIRLVDLLPGEDLPDKQCSEMRSASPRNREGCLPHSPASKATRSALKARADRSERLVQ